MSKSNSQTSAMYEYVEEKIASSILNKPKKVDMVDVVLQNRELFKHYNSETIEKLQVKYIKQYAAEYNKKAKGKKVEPEKILNETKDTSFSVGSYSDKQPTKEWMQKQQYSYGTIYEHIEKKIAQAFRESNDLFHTTNNLEKQYKHFDQTKIESLLLKYLEFHSPNNKGA